MDRARVINGDSDPALITIGITCYREGDWLAECWNSVLAQTDDRWEAVIVLDRAHDEMTRSVFDAIEHPKLRKVIMPQHVGPYSARNEAFALTRTPYHFYLDGDDQLPRDSLAVVLKTFASDPNIDFVYGDYVCFGNSSEIWIYPRKVSADDFVDAQPTPGGAAYKRLMWDRLGGFAKELDRGNGDYDFLIAAYEAGFRGQHCGRVIYNCRIGHGGRVSSSYNCRYHETHEIMVSRHPRFFADASRRRRFLALGYRRAALANRAAGEEQAAARLAMAACRNGLWRDAEMQILVLKKALPGWAFNTLRNLWHLVRTA